MWCQGCYLLGRILSFICLLKILKAFHMCIPFYLCSTHREVTPVRIWTKSVKSWMWFWASIVSPWALCWPSLVSIHLNSERTRLWHNSFSVFFWNYWRKNTIWSLWGWNLQIKSTKSLEFKSTNQIYSCNTLVWKQRLHFKTSFFCNGFAKEIKYLANVMMQITIQCDCKRNPNYIVSCIFIKFNLESLSGDS